MRVELLRRRSVYKEEDSWRGLVNGLECDVDGVVLERGVGAV